MAAESNLVDTGRRSETLRRVVLIAVELVVTVGALILLFRGVDLPETARAFGKANYWLLIPAVIFLVLDLQLRAVRWRFLLSPHQGLHHGNLFGSMNVGYFINGILPFRAGEVARVFLIDELEKTGKVRSAASIAVERGIDVIAMVALVIALFPFIDEPDWTHGPALLIGAGALAAFALLIALSHVNESDRAFWKGWLLRVPRFGEHLEQASNTILMALRPLRNFMTLSAVIALTVVIWTCGTLSFLMVMDAFHLDVGFRGAAIVVGATTLGMVVPSSPGYVGVFHAIAVKTLTEVFGVPKETALTYAIAQHALLYMVQVVLGGSFLWTHRPMWHDFAATLGLRNRRLKPAAIAVATTERSRAAESIES